MTGYREHSFDPNAVEGLGRPLRPYNNVQRAGVVLQVLAILAYAYHFAAMAEVVPEPRVDPMSFGVPLLIVGMTLVFSRREGEIDLAPELAAGRKRWTVIIIAICVALFAVAGAIEFLGA